MDISNKKIIFPHGFSFWFLFLLLFCFSDAGLFLIIAFFINIDINIYNKWYTLIVGIIGLGICIYEYYILFSQAPVKFIDNQFITKGKNPRYFPPIKVDCKDIVSYELLSISIKFTLSNGKKKDFHMVQFTKKQNLQILQEIKNRGGLQNQEIKLDNYYFNTNFKSKKK